MIYLYELGPVYYLVYPFDFSDIDAVVSQWIIYMYMKKYSNRFIQLSPSPMVYLRAFSSSRSISLARWDQPSQYGISLLRFQSCCCCLLGSPAAHTPLAAGLDFPVELLLLGL